MADKSSRRDFLAAAGLALPTVAFSSVGRVQQARTLPPPKPELSYRVLGKTGLKVTSVGFGCMITSDPSVIERAADIGITYFDSARGYQNGNNERMVGAALKSKRNSITLSTKTQARTKEEALKHIDTSLAELGTDHVDIWYLHGKSKPEDLTDELLEAQQIAKKAGKTRFVGVSTHGGQRGALPRGDPEDAPFRRDPDVLQLHDGPQDGRAHRRRGEAGHRDRRDEGDGGRLPQGEAGRQADRDPEARGRDARRPEVGAEEQGCRHDHSEHHGQRAAGGEPEGHVGRVLRRGPEDPHGAVGPHRPAVLQDVRQLLGPVPERAAGLRRDPFRQLLRTGTASSSWRARASCRCRRRSGPCAAGTASPARFAAPTGSG